MNKQFTILKNIRNFDQFKFAFFIVSPILFLLSQWIYLKVSISEDQGYYAATSEASTINGYASFFGLERAVQTFLFVLFSVVLFLLFRMAMSNLLSLFAVVIFMINAQVQLVYLSAPFWDFSTAIIPLMAITLVFASLKKQYLSFSFSKNMRCFVSIAIISVNLASQVLYYRVSNLRAQRSIATLVAVLVVVTVIFVWLGSQKKVFFSQKKNLGPQAFERQIIIPILFTFLTLQPIIGRGGKSYATLILVVCLIFHLLGEINIGPVSKIVVLGLFLFIIRERSNGDYFLFYFFTGLANAPQLVTGRSNHNVSLGVPFTDETLWAISQLNSAHGLRATFLFVTFNLTTICRNIEIGFLYLLKGFWVFSEPPLWQQENFVLIVRSKLWNFIASVAPFLSGLSLVHLVQKSRKSGLFAVSIATILLASFATTRPQMHQWWTLQIFGYFGCFYGMSTCVSRIYKSIFADILTASNGARFKNNFINLRLIDTRILLKHGFKYLVFLLITGATTSLVFGGLNFFAQKIETDRLTVLATSYASQNWKDSVNRTDSSHIELQDKSNLIRVSVGDNCDLTGLRISYLNSNLFAKEKMGGMGGGNVNEEYYKTKFYIAKTKANVIYVPYFPINIFQPNISIDGISPSCRAQISQARVIDGSLPLLGLLVLPDKTARYASAPKNLQKMDSIELLSTPIRFRGYQDNSGYQAVGDESGVTVLADQIGDKILGRSKQGYQEIDIWRHQLQVGTKAIRVQVFGEFSRGVLVIGWAKPDPISLSAIPMEFDYAVRGSIFETSTRVIHECFEIPGAHSNFEFIPIELFIGSVFDLYSPRWTNFEIDSVTIDHGDCHAHSKTRNFLPTL